MEKYENPIIEIVAFDAEDIITTSNEGEEYDRLHKITLL